MKIDVNEQTVEQFFDLSKTTLVVPDYQRPYSWGVSQWSDFWEDLDSLGQNETHFLGAIVLIAGMFNPGEFNELELVDGQQRLVTISIFLKVVQDLYEEAGNSQMAKEIEVYLFSKMLGKERKIRLRLGKADRDVYENLIMGRLELIQDKTIYKAYSFFKNILKDHKDLDDISKKLIDNLSFVAITTHDERSAYRLFETLNDRGLDLSAVDLIKNHLLRIVSESGGNTTEFVKNNWEGMIGNLEDIDKVRYFRHYLMSSSFCVLKGKITKDGLYDKFCNTLKKMEDIQGFVEDINRQSYLYGQLVNYRTDIFDQGRNEAINEHLRNLVAIKATTSYTFLLKIFTKLKKAEDIIKILKLIEVFAMRRIIVGVSTADLDLIYNT